MTLIEMIEQSTKLLQRFSKKKKFYKTKHEQINDQPQSIPLTNSFLSPSSIMTRSDISRSISNNSITFASVFDQSNNENTSPTFHFDSSNEIGDLVIVVPNKFVTNEPILQANKTEPYPFRSEIPSYKLSKSHSSNYLSSSNFSRKRSFRNLIHSRRPKKLHHPIRTKSAPDLISTMTQPITYHHHHQQKQHQKLKPIRQWFKSSSVGRLIHTFVKHPTPIYSNKIESKSPIILSKYSDVIY